MKLSTIRRINYVNLGLGGSLTIGFLSSVFPMFSYAIFALLLIGIAVLTAFDVNKLYNMPEAHPIGVAISIGLGAVMALLVIGFFVMGLFL